MKKLGLLIALLLSVCKLQAEDKDPLKIRTWQVDLGATYLGKGEGNGNVLLNAGFNYVFPETPLYIGVTNDVYYRFGIKRRSNLQ